jgi:hypothetical protein
MLVGRHGGKGTLGKILNLFRRSGELRKTLKPMQIHLAVSHGSRTQVLAAWRLGIPSLIMLDYEYTESRLFNLMADHLLLPELIPQRRLAEAGFRLSKVLRYRGFKEEIYLRDFVPDTRFRRFLNIPPEAILVTLRPPGTLANYHDPRSEELFRKCVEHCSSAANTVCLVVGRTQEAAGMIPEHLAHKENVMLLSHAVDGVQLIWSSDIVISGGGTMNRESALLGVPTFSIFTGKRPYLDEYLQENGKLRFIENVGQVGSIPVQRRNRSVGYKAEAKNLALEITELMIELSGKPARV